VTAARQLERLGEHKQHHKNDRDIDEARVNAGAGWTRLKGGGQRLYTKNELSGGDSKGLKKMS
jgi:hypothetical protein